MAQEKRPLNVVEERCERCERTTAHRVKIEFVTESEQPRNREFSRQPHRVSVCEDCGTQRRRRMNGRRTVG